MVAGLAFMFTPLAVVVLLFATQLDPLAGELHRLQHPWYHEALTSPDWHASMQVSVEIAVVTTIVCAIVGTLLALGLQRGAKAATCRSNGPVVAGWHPETATAVATLLLFSEMGVVLDNRASWP